jgi:hypothetical protein
MTTGDVPRRWSDYLCHLPPTLDERRTGFGHDDAAIARVMAQTVCARRGRCAPPGSGLLIESAIRQSRGMDGLRCDSFTVRAATRHRRDHPHGVIDPDVIRIKFVAERGLLKLIVLLFE